MVKRSFGCENIEHSTQRRANKLKNIYCQYLEKKEKRLLMSTTEQISRRSSRPTLHSAIRTQSWAPRQSVLPSASPHVCNIQRKSWWGWSRSRNSIILRRPINHLPGRRLRFPLMAWRLSPPTVIIFAGQMRSEQLNTHASASKQASQEAFILLTQSP